MICGGLLRSACRQSIRANFAPRLTSSSRLQFAPAACRAFGSGGDPRGHLNPDGTRPEAEDAENYHDPDPIDHQPKLNRVKERGQLWVVSGDPPKTAGELWEDIP